MKVKIFDDTYIDVLEREINKFFEMQKAHNPISFS